MTDSDAPRLLSLEERIKVAEASLARLLEWISRYESKSGFVLGIVTAMIGVLAAFTPAVPTWSSLALVTSSLAAASLAATLYCLFQGNSPRTKGEESLLYFASIAAMTGDDYRHRVMALTTQRYLDELLGQSHVIARILDVKFRMLAWAYRFLFSAVPFWAVAIYLLRALVPPK
jgi:hypothetical protein